MFAETIIRLFLISFTVLTIFCIEGVIAFMCGDIKCECGGHEKLITCHHDMYTIWEMQDAFSSLVHERYRYIQFTSQDIGCEMKIKLAETAGFKLFDVCIEDKKMFSQKVMSSNTGNLQKVMSSNTGNATNSDGSYIADICVKLLLFLIMTVSLVCSGKLAYNHRPINKFLGDDYRKYSSFSSFFRYITGREVGINN